MVPVMFDLQLKEPLKRRETFGGVPSHGEADRCEEDEVPKATFYAFTALPGSWISYRELAQGSQKAHYGSPGSGLTSFGWHGL